MNDSAATDGEGMPTEREWLEGLPEDDFAGSAGPREHVLDPNAKSYAPDAACDHVPAPARRGAGGGGRLNAEAHRLAAEIRADGEAEVVGFKTLRGYSPTYMEIDGVPVELPQSERREAPGIRVRRTNGEIALYLTATIERAQTLLEEARRIAEVSDAS